MFTFLFLLSLPLMSTHSFENLLFPIEHFFPGPVRWTFGETSLTVILHLFSLFPVTQYHNHKPAVLHRLSSHTPLPQSRPHACITCFLSHCSPSPHCFQPAVFKHGRRCVPCLMRTHPECFYILSLSHLGQIEYPCSFSLLVLFCFNFVAFCCGFHYFHFTEIIPIKKWPKISKAKSLFFSFLTPYLTVLLDLANLIQLHYACFSIVHFICFWSFFFSCFFFMTLFDLIMILSGGPTISLGC